MGTPKLSFTFAKQKRTTLPISTPLVSSNAPVKTECREYITVIEDHVIKTDKPQEPQLVIPLIASKNGIRERIRSIRKDIVSYDPLTEKAIKELKREADLSDHENDTGLITIPPKKVAVSDAETDDINYDEVPVEKFGLAVLAGMGFDPNLLKTSASQSVGPIRPKGLGLGADPNAAKAAKEDATAKSEEKLVWRPGARCHVVLGKHKGSYGTVNGLDGDTGRVIVKLTISKEIVAILQPMLRLVSEKEYSKYANCLNQREVDEYKENEAKHQSSLRNHVGDPTQLVQKSTENAQNSSPSDRTWVRPNLVVKFLDKRYKDGRYYKEKVIVTSVTADRCTCRTSSGEVIQDVKAKYLQTVVPRENGSMVMILSGARAGEMAKLMDQNPRRNEVDLRTRAGTMIQLTYDQVCCIETAP